MSLEFGIWGGLEHAPVQSCPARVGQLGGCEMWGRTNKFVFVRRAVHIPFAASAFKTQMPT